MTPLTSSERALWRATLLQDPKGIAAALAEGASPEARVPAMGIQVSVTLVQRLQNELPSPIDDMLFRSLERAPRSGDDYQEPLWTPLHAACHFNLPATRRALLAGGVSPNCADDNGLTPLLMAVYRGDVEAASDLLAAGADPNQAQPKSEEGTGANGHAPLVRAAGDGNLALVELLLAHGAKVDAPDGAGRTALLAASARPHGIFWRDLMEQHGNEADVSEDPTEPLKRLSEALAEGASRPSGLLGLDEAEPTGDHDAIVTLLLSRGANPDHEAPGDAYLGQGGTPLLQAIQRGDQTLIERLLAAGAPLRPAGGTTPLHLALRHGPILLQRLIAAGADPEARDSDNLPAYAAAVLHSAEALAVFKEAGCSLHRRGEQYGTTLLHLAAPVGNTETVRYLLDEGLEVDATCERPSDELVQGVTPLMLAAGRRQHEVVALLLERGADPHRKDSQGRTARDYALEAQERTAAGRTKVEASQVQDLPRQVEGILEGVSGELREQMEEQVAAVNAGFASMWTRFFAEQDRTLSATLALLP